MNNMNLCKLSIIIPVYNVEIYIDKCLRSCIDQDIPLSNYEIIVVNDGTKDNSLLIVTSIAEEYSNIIIVSQENEGLGSARNKGLSLAKGEFVWFVDSDDWILSNCLRKITDLASKPQLDGVIICAATIENGIPRIRHDYSKLNKTTYSGIELLKTSYWEPCVPFTVYRRKFLHENNLKFVEGILHEDLEFSPRSYYFAKQIGILTDICYFVNLTPNSITRSVNHKKAFDYIKVAGNIARFSQSVSPESVYLYDNLISLILNNSLHYSYEMNKDTIRNLNAVIYRNKALFKHLRRSTYLKYRMEAILFITFKKQYVRIYKLLQLMNKNQKNNIGFINKFLKYKFLQK